MFRAAVEICRARILYDMLKNSVQAVISHCLHAVVFVKVALKSQYLYADIV